MFFNHMSSVDNKSHFWHLNINNNNNNKFLVSNAPTENVNKNSIQLNDKKWIGKIWLIKSESTKSKSDKSSQKRYYLLWFYLSKIKFFHSIFIKMTPGEFVVSDEMFDYWSYVKSVS